MLGYPATVVVPMATKPAMIAKLRAIGAADVIQHGAAVADADRYLKEFVLPNDPDGVYVPPFDHPDIWEGNATVMQEIADQMEEELDDEDDDGVPVDKKPDVVICSVGGGGLMNGIVQEIDRRGWTDSVDVVAMETDGADSLNRSVRAGRLLTLDRITSKATSLGVAKVSALTYDYACKRPDHVISAVLPDSEAARGCWLLAETERLMAELTVGVNIALCYDGLLQKVLDGTTALSTSTGRRAPLTKASKVVIVVCGGNDISIDMLFAWKKEREMMIQQQQQQQSQEIDNSLLRTISVAA